MGTGGGSVVAVAVVSVMRVSVVLVVCGLSVLPVLRTVHAHNGTPMGYMRLGPIRASFRASRSLPWKGARTMGRSRRFGDSARPRPASLPAEAPDEGVRVAEVTGVNRRETATRGLDLLNLRLSV
ncbi:hypothetical protein JCM18899A_32740 [Nocardioides sp. AN3]